MLGEGWGVIELVEFTTHGVHPLARDQPTRAVLHGHEVGLGRNAQAQVRMSKLLTWVSNKHLTLGRDAMRQPYVQDTSSNGTWVNGTRLASHAMHNLREADLIELAAEENGRESRVVFRFLLPGSQGADAKVTTGADAIAAGTLMADTTAGDASVGALHGNSRAIVPQKRRDAAEAATAKDGGLAWKRSRQMGSAVVETRRVAEAADTLGGVEATLGSGGAALQIAAALHSAVAALRNDDYDASRTSPSTARPASPAAASPATVDPASVDLAAVPIPPGCAEPMAGVGALPPAPGDGIGPDGATCAELEAMRASLLQAQADLRLMESSLATERGAAQQAVREAVRDAEAAREQQAAAEQQRQQARVEAQQAAEELSALRTQVAEASLHRRLEDEAESEAVRMAQLRAQRAEERAQRAEERAQLAALQAEMEGAQARADVEVARAEAEVARAEVERVRELLTEQVESARGQGARESKARMQAEQTALVAQAAADQAEKRRQADEQTAAQVRREVHMAREEAAAAREEGGRSACALATVTRERDGLQRERDGLQRERDGLQQRVLSLAREAAT